MPTRPSQRLAPLDVVDGVATYRPRGDYSLVEAVELVSDAIAYCRDGGVAKLLIDGTEVTGVSIPTLVDRFLMVEEWAQESGGTVIVVLVVLPEYIHPERFGVKVAAYLGLVCDVYASEEAAWKWLHEIDAGTFRPGE